MTLNRVESLESVIAPGVIVDFFRGLLDGLLHRQRAFLPALGFGQMGIPKDSTRCEYEQQADDHFGQHIGHVVGDASPQRRAPDDHA